MPRPTPLARLLASAALISAWLVALLVGWTLGGAVYLLLLTALAVFPWQSVRSRDPVGSRPQRRRNERS